MAHSKLSICKEEKSLECSICLSDFSKPKLLPCLHTFCTTCLKRYCEDIDEEEKPCPLCRRKFTVPAEGVEKFKDDVVMARLVPDKTIAGVQKRSKCQICEKKDAQAYCIECKQDLCAACRQSHAKFSSSKLHRTVLVEDKPALYQGKTIKTDYCVVHAGNRIELYCCDCKKFLCRTCHATEHSKHMCKVPSEVAKSKYQQFAEDQRNVARCITDGNDQINSSKVGSTLYLEEISKIQKIVEKAFSDMINHLVEQNSNLVSSIEKIRAAKIKAIECEDEFHFAELNSFLSHSRMLLERGTDCEIIEAAEELHERAIELVKSQNFSEKKLSLFQLFTSDIEELKNLILKTDLPQTLGEIMQYPDILAQRLAVLKGGPDTTSIQIDETPIAVTAIHDKIYVAQEKKSQVVVYDSFTLTAQPEIDVPDMKSPGGLAGCSQSKALYISDDELDFIHRVNLTDNTTKRWKIKYSNPQGLSMTIENNVLVTVEMEPSRILEYTSEGLLIHDIKLDNSIDDARQTIQLSTEQFLVICHGDAKDKLSRICMVNPDGQIIKSYSEGKEGCDGLMKLPFSLTIDRSCDLVLVGDSLNCRILMFSSELVFLGQVKIKQDLMVVTNVYFDSGKDRLFVGDLTERLLVVNASA